MELIRHDSLESISHRVDIRDPLECADHVRFRDGVADVEDKTEKDDTSERLCSRF